MRRLIGLGLLVLLDACSSSPKGDNQTYDLSFEPIDLAGADFTGVIQDLSGVDLAIQNTSASPVIEVQHPLSTEDVLGSTLAVTVKVTSPGGTAIDTVVLETPGSMINMVAAGTNIFTGTADISAVAEMGMFSITATDVMHQKGGANVSYRHDRGPQIKFVAPTAATAKGTVSVRVIVSDALYSPIDPAKVIGTLKTKGDIALTADPGSSPLQMSAMIDLNKFSPALAGPQTITVEATNSYMISAEDCRREGTSERLRMANSR